MRHRKSAATCNEPLSKLDYTALRPFEEWSAPLLETLAGGWLKMDPPCLELATLALEELSERRADLNIRLKFDRAELAPIPWLMDARAAVLGKLAPDARKALPKGRKAGSVYVILRGGYMETNGWYGAYVGSTTRTVEARYKEHRSGGKRSARGLPTHGIEPLYSLFLPLNPLPAHRPSLMEWETRLHECLAPIVPKVTGDVAF